jgi:ribonuclease BN (tRNA processing enzyme)
MKLTVLGSGSSVPNPKRSSSAYWLETDSGTLLLDCSASAIHRMAEEDLDWADLDAIWTSHFHLDHCGGLAPFLFATKHAPDTQDRTKPLRIFGPKGLRGLISNFDLANNYGLLHQPFPVEIIEVESLEAFDIFPDLTGTALSTPHTDESHAIHLRNSKDKTLVYTSDTGLSEPLAAFARKIDLLLIECSFVKNKPVEKHLELAEAMYLIRKARPQKAVLTHFYPEWDEVDFEKEIVQFSPMCEIVEACDGLRITLGND